MTAGPNTSSSGGYLTPIAERAISDDDLADVLQRAARAMTGLAGDLVRPRFQPTPPRQPANDENWCAIGVLDTEGGTAVDMIHKGFDDEGRGISTLRTFDIVNVMATFYGPNAMGYARRLRDGLKVAQNRWMIQGDGSLNLVSTGDVRQAGETASTAFRSRFDFTFVLRQRIERDYLVRNIDKVVGSIISDSLPPMPFEAPKG